MKVFIVLFFALFPFSLGKFHRFFENTRRHQHGILKSSLSDASTALNSLQYDEELDNTKKLDYYTYVRDVLPFGNDTNEKIQKKIIQQLKDIPSNFKNLRNPIILTTDGFSFLRTLTMKFDSDPKSVIVFHNLTASYWYDDDYDRKTFSILISCDSSTKPKIRVGLPSNVQIVANLSVTNPSTGSANQGSISLVLRNGSISKQIATFDDDKFEDAVTRISFTNSKLDIQSNLAPQFLLDINLQALYQDIEFSLREFFANQLNEEIVKRDLHLTATCSQIRFNDESQTYKLHPLSLFINNLFNNLYVISNARTETWKGITLDAGPIIMTGFSNYNSSELYVSRKYDYNERRYVKKLSSSMKINNLNGQFESTFYNSNLSRNSSMVFTFVVEYVQLENNYEFVDSWPASWTQDMKVYVGRTQIIRNKAFKSQSNMYEVQLTNSLLSEYLKFVITESLGTSLKERLHDTDFSFIETFFKDD